MEIVPTFFKSAVSTTHVAAACRARRRPSGRSGVLLLGSVVALFSCWMLGNAETAQRSSDSLAFVSDDLAKQLAPLLVSLAIGLLLYNFGQSKGTETVAIIMIYFGAQTGMNIYMKNVLSKIVVDKEEGLKGIPIGFLLTAIQQFVAFLTFGLFVFGGRLFGAAYQVKRLTSRKEVVAVLCFGLAFALNIGLNNFSLSLISISINLIIRSCLPLTTAISQIIIGYFLGDDVKASQSAAQWALMLAGVGCAGLATYAKSGGPEDSASLTLGVTIAVASICSGAVNMVLAGILGTAMKLNPIDTTCYMALPAGLSLLLPSLFVSHPMKGWPGFPSMTDWEVLQEVMSRNPSVLLPVLFSGVLAFIYNILQYSIVHKLSASYATFAGNFNKAATVALSLLLGLEALPDGNYGIMFIVAVAGNIAAFTLYSSIQVQPQVTANVRNEAEIQLQTTRSNEDVRAPNSG